MRRVNCTQVYGEGRVTIMGRDLYVMDIPLPILHIDMGLSTIEFDEDDKTADQACKISMSREKHNSDLVG